MTPALRRLAAFGVLLVALALMVGVAMSGFYLETRERGAATAQEGRLKILQARIRKFGSNGEAGQPEFGAGNAKALLLDPAAAPGAAGAAMQSRLITMIVEAGGRVESARVLEPLGQDQLTRISVDVSAELKTRPLRDLLVALERMTPVGIVERLDVRRIGNAQTRDGANTSQQDPSLAVSFRLSSYMKRAVDGEVRQ